MFFVLIFLLALGEVSQIDAQNITTIAGSNYISSIPPEPALRFAFRSIGNIAVDAKGNLYIPNYSQVLKVDASGNLTVFAGNGQPCAASSCGDNGPATAAELVDPRSVAVDSAGNVYIGEGTDVRRVSLDGTITTVAGGGKMLGDGGPATAAQVSPDALAADSSGNLYIAEFYRVRKVSGGIINTVAGNGQLNFGVPADGSVATQAPIIAGSVAVDSGGDIYIGEGGGVYSNAGGSVLKVTPDGILHVVAGTGTPGFAGDGSAAASATVDQPSSVAVDSSGSVYFADEFNNRIRKIASGTINTVAGTGQAGWAGDGGPALSAELLQPQSIAVDSAGNIFGADSNTGVVRKITPAGTISQYAGSGTYSYSGDGGPATLANLYLPVAVAADSAGNVFVADSHNNRVRKIDPKGNIVTIAGNGFPGFSGDGGPAASARLYAPNALAFDASGNLYISDAGNNRIRAISTQGVITTVAGNGAPSGEGLPLVTSDGPATTVSLQLEAAFGNPYFPGGVAADAGGNIYLSDAGNCRVRKLTPDGTIITLAGTSSPGIPCGPPLASPRGLAVDAAGNVYIADGQYVREIAAGGTLTTIAGNGKGYSGDGGPAVSAGLDDVTGVTMDSSGNLFIADSNGRIPTAGFAWWIPMGSSAPWPA